MYSLRHGEDVQRGIKKLRETRELARTVFDRVGRSLGKFNGSDLCYAWNYLQATLAEQQDPSKKQNQIEDWGLNGPRRVEVQQAVDKIYFSERQNNR